MRVWRLFARVLLALPLVWTTLSAPPSVLAESVDYSSHLKGIVANAFLGEGMEDASAVATLGGRAFVGGEEFWVINTGVPASPRILGSVPLADRAKSIAIGGFFAYVAVGSPGLEIIRVVIPSNPTVTDIVPVAGNANDVVVQGDYAYVADGNGLRVIDVSDPTNGMAVGVFVTGSASAVEISGDTAFLASGNNLFALDVSDPAHISQLGRISVTAIRDLAVEGNWLYAIRQSGWSQLAVYAVSDPTNPVLTGSVNLQYENARALAASYPYVYACTAGIWTNMSLEVVDVSDPARPTVVGHTAAGFWDVADVAVDNGIAYVADDIWGLNILDVSNPESVPILRQYPTGDFAEDVALAGDYAMVADRNDGLTVIDLVGGGIAAQLPSVGEAYDVAVVGDLAFLLGDSGLSIVDIADPVQPILLSRTSMPGQYGYDFDVDGDYAYVANGETNLVIVDISDPVHPVIVSTYPGPFYEARGVAAAWPFVYLGDVGHGLHIVDVTDPANPVGRGSASPHLQSWGYAGSVAVYGHYVYKADGYSGMWVADVLDPDNPGVASVHPNFVTYRCAVHGSILYTARIDLGMQMWSLEPDPANPELIGEAETTGQVFGLAVGPESIFLADERNGLTVVPLHDALVGVGEDADGSRSFTFTVGPNPTRGPVRLEFGRPIAGIPSAEVLDAGGRRIRLLSDGGAKGKGKLVLDWDLRDDGARPVPAGVYFFRLWGNGFGGTRTITVVR